MGVYPAKRETMDIFIVKGEIKRYAWGTSDFIKSLVGLDAEGVVAEYWLGTHYLGEAKDSTGHLLREKINHRLSFLLKVLSISSPLAIQCHPTKNEAMEGFKKECALSVPQENRNYSDENDKTEAAIALSDFTVLCGFRELFEAKANILKYTPSLYEVIKNCSSVEELMITIKEIGDDNKNQALTQLKEKIEGVIVPSSPVLSMEELCAFCLSLYPDDIWCVSPLILNVIHLKAYEAIFIKPGIVNAYCRGNCMEIMTSSDNMTRLGLTCRFKDENEFMKIADFSEGMNERVKELILSNGAFSYDFPYRNFSLIRYEKGKHLIPLRKDGVMFVIEGEANLKSSEKEILMKRGDAAFIPEEIEVTMEVDGVVFFAYEKPKN